MAEQKGGQLAEDGQFALRSELGRLMRIARFARHDATYGAAVSAKTSEETGEKIIINPIDFGEIDDVDWDKATANFKT